MSTGIRLGQTVYLITDPDQHARMVTGITLRPESTIYHLSLADTESQHYRMEISTEPDHIKRLE